MSASPGLSLRSASLIALQPSNVQGRRCYGLFVSRYAARTAGDHEIGFKGNPTTMTEVAFMHT